ncbi:hypothetical protein ACET3Z_021972 [Daucus carota]
MYNVIKVSFTSLNRTSDCNSSGLFIWKVLKKEKEERRAKAGSSNKHTSTGNGKVDGPDLKSFIQQFPVTSEGGETPSVAGIINPGAEGF